MPSRCTPSGVATRIRAIRTRGTSRAATSTSATAHSGPRECRARIHTRTCPRPHAALTARHVARALTRRPPRKSHPGSSPSAAHSCATPRIASSYTYDSNIVYRCFDSCFAAGQPGCDPKWGCNFAACFDDRRFVRALVHALVTSMCVDLRQVHLTGISAGGMHAARGRLELDWTGHGWLLRKAHEPSPSECHPSSALLCAQV